MPRRLCLALIIAVAILPWAAARERMSDPQDLSGAWRGTWHCDKTGHQGPLRAQLRRCDATHYEATFTGRFFKIFPFRYTVTLEAIPSADGCTVFLSGCEDLGKLRPRIYTYQGEGDSCELQVGYCSARHTGTFNLHR